MYRVLISPEASPPVIVLSDPEILHHLCGVLRAKGGQAIECLDGAGRRLQGVIESSSKREMRVRVTQDHVEPPPALKIILAQSLIKREPFEWLLQKATELGVWRIVPVLATRSSQRAPEEGFSKSRLLRWRRILEAASLQSGRAWLPALEEPTSLENALAAAPKLRFILVAGDPAGEPAAQALTQAGRDGGEVMIAVGPEGDFSPEEAVVAKEYQCRSLWLGKTVLRSETAAVAALVALQLGPRGLFSSTKA